MEQLLVGRTQRRDLRRDDYQQFDFSDDGELIDIGPRMSQKLEAIPLPDIKGKSVLDIGCDMGFWSFKCAEADRVVGLDRSRSVKGHFLDLIEYNRHVTNTFDRYKHCEFYPINLGRQWKTYGEFDFVMLFSLYHHIFEQSKDHHPIWFWLWQHTKGELLWENPVDPKDRVVQINVSSDYNQGDIFVSSLRFFDRDYIGPAKHEPHRFVYRFYPKELPKKVYTGYRSKGAGGASKAWAYADSRRTKEFKDAIGVEPIQGSINLRLTEPFDWDHGYYRTPILDVKDRSRGIDSPWEERWCRIYPLKANGVDAFAFRFEGERYPEWFMEIVSEHQIDDPVIEIENSGRA